MMLFSVAVLLTIIPFGSQVTYPCDRRVACGCSANSASVNRIVGGETAGPATWGWVVSISLPNNDLCAGSIISSSWIITAAHCFADFSTSYITIYAGSIGLWASTQTRAVSQIIIHPNYKASTYENDIALLKLVSPIVMSDLNVSPICIPSISLTTSTAREWPPAGTSVVTVGWGLLSEAGPVAQTLQQVTLSTVDYRASTCNSLVVDSSVQLCAGVLGGGKDTCQGDSGGPLMMFSSSKQWVLVGLTSYGRGCARPSYSGVYTRVAPYENWIGFHTNGAYESVLFSHANTYHSSSAGFLYSILLILLYITFITVE